MSDKTKTAPSDFGGNLGSAFAFHDAEVNGHVVVLPAPDELFIDIDNDAAELLFHKHLPKVEQFVGVRTWNFSPSKSGEPERKHITVTLSKQVSPLERILLQAVLGSDLRRELLSYCRWSINDPNPTLFFEKGQKQLPAAPEPQLLSPVMDDGTFTEPDPYDTTYQVPA